MKVIAVLGSPQENGPSSTLAMEAIRGAKDAGHKVVIYELNKMNVQGCQGCGYCKANDKDCRLEDDLAPYWKDLHEAGALIVSAPNYCSQVCGPMITYMNRHYCMILFKEEGAVCRLHPGIKLIGIFSQGNGDPEAYMDNYMWYLNDFCNRDMKLQKVLVHTRGTELAAGTGLMQEAYEAGNAL